MVVEQGGRSIGVGGLGRDGGGYWAGGVTPHTGTRNGGIGTAEPKWELEEGPCAGCSLGSSGARAR